MSNHTDASPVVLLVAARDFRTACEAAATHHGIAPRGVALLTYESHQALPDLPLHVDPSWAGHRSAQALREIIAIRFRGRR